MAACLAVGVGTASASPLPLTQGAIVASPGSTCNCPGGPYNVGWEFTLSSSYDVTHLGYLDESGDGFNESHSVGIYSTTGVPLTSAVITSADPLQNGFRWASIAATTLAAGTYIVDGTAGTELYQFSGEAVTFDPRVTWVEGLYTINAALVFPGTVNPNPQYSYFGPNFGTEPAFLFATAVPEPGR